jgi:hypothetical protein
MKRFTRLVLLLLLVEIVIAAALGTRVRRQLEQPVTYLGRFLVPAEPLHVGDAGAAVLDAREHEEQVG